MEYHINDSPRWAVTKQFNTESPSTPFISAVFVDGNDRLLQVKTSADLLINGNNNNNQNGGAIAVQREFVVSGWGVIDDFGRIASTHFPRSGIIILLLIIITII